MQSIPKWVRLIDPYNQIIEYQLDADSEKQVFDLFEFETEDSEAAPEPSVACRVRAKNGLEYCLLFVQRPKTLLVFSEFDVNRKICLEVFLKECPQLNPYLQMTYPEPHSEYPSGDIVKRDLERQKNYIERSFFS